VKEYAQTIYEYADEHVSDSLFVSALKVKSAERCPGPGPRIAGDLDLPREDPDFALTRGPGARGKVQSYTIFGLPSYTIELTCNEW